MNKSANSRALIDLMYKLAARGPKDPYLQLLAAVMAARMEAEDRQRAYAAAVARQQAAQRQTPKVSRTPAGTTIITGTGRYPTEQEVRLNRRSYAQQHANDYAWGDSEDAWHKEFARRMKSGMGYSGADVHGQMISELAKLRGVSPESLEAQYGAWSDNAIMRHNGNLIRKFIQANLDNQDFVNQLLDGDLESLASVGGADIWMRNQHNRDVENLRREQSRGGYLGNGRVKPMTGRLIYDKYNASEWGPKARAAKKRQLAVAASMGLGMPDPQQDPEGYTKAMIADQKRRNANTARKTQMTASTAKKNKVTAPKVRSTAPRRLGKVSGKVYTDSSGNRWRVHSNGSMSPL